MAGSGGKSRQKKKRSIQVTRSNPLDYSPSYREVSGYSGSPTMRSGTSSRARAQMLVGDSVLIPQERALAAKKNAILSRGRKKK